MEEPIKSVENRREDGTFGPGNNANPNGRPKGKTLKEWAREKLIGMTDEEKEEFIKTLPKDIVWRMAEGNPHQTTDMGVELKPSPLLDVLRNNNSDQTDSEPKETN